LRARHHQIEGTQFGDLQHTFHHRQGVGIEQVAVVGILQGRKQFGPVFRLAKMNALRRSRTVLCRI